MKHITKRLAVLAMAAALILIMLPAVTAKADVTFSPWSSKPVYRLWLPANGDHFYTMSAVERDWLVRESGWVAEGTSWVAPTEYNSDSPVYRVWNQYNGDHFYTMDWNEVQYIVTHSNEKNNWVYEGVAWYSADAKSGDLSKRVPVYRLFNPQQPDYWPGSHHYTTDAYERQVLLSGGIWRDEGIAWYGVPDQMAELASKLNKQGTLAIEADEAYVQMEATIQLNNTGASGSSVKVVISQGSRVVSFGLGNQANLTEQFPWYTNNTEFVLENIYDPDLAATAGLEGKNYLHFATDDKGNLPQLGTPYDVRLTWNKNDKRLRAYINDKEMTTGYENWTKIDFDASKPFTVAVEGGVKHGGDIIDCTLTHVKFKIGDSTLVRPVTGTDKYLYRGAENGWNDQDLDFFGLDATVVNPGTAGPDARYTIWSYEKEAVGGYDATFTIKGTANCPAGYDWDTCFQITEPRTGQKGKPLSAQVNLSQWQSNKNPSKPDPE